MEHMPSMLAMGCRQGEHTRETWKERCETHREHR